MRKGRGRKRLDRAYALGADHEHFPRLDVPDIRGANQIHRARFGRDHRGVVEPSERERPEAVRIADRNHAITGHQGQRKRALHLRNRFDQGVHRIRRLRSRIEVQNDFGVAARLKDRALPHQFASKLAGVDQVPVVAHRDLPVRALDQDRLRVGELALAGGGIANVADRRRTGKT